MRKTILNKNVLYVLFISFLSSSLFGQWVNVGSAEFASSSPYNSSFFMDQNNTLYVAYSDYDNSSKTTVRRYNGILWEAVGISGFTPNNTYKNKIRVDNNEVPYIAFTNYYSSQISVMKFDGTGWINQGNHPAKDLSGGFGCFGFALDNNNIPHLAFSDSNNNGNITVKKLVDGNWLNLGTAGSSDSLSIADITFDSDNKLHIAFYKQGNNGKCAIMKLNGTDWKELGNFNSTDKNINFLSLEIADTIPYILFSELDSVKSIPKVMKFNGNDWVSIGESSLSLYQAVGTSIAIDPLGSPYIFFRKADDNGVIMKFNGIDWEEIEESNLGTSVYSITGIKIDKSGSPYIAYEINHYPASAPKLNVMKFQAKTSINTFAKNNLKIFPTITQGIINIKKEESQVFTLNIFNLLGKQIFNQTIKDKESNIDISSYANGIYFFTIHDSDTSQNFKIILNH